MLILGSCLGLLLLILPAYITLESSVADVHGLDGALFAQVRERIAQGTESSVQGMAKEALRLSAESKLLMAGGRCVNETSGLAMTGPWSVAMNPDDGMVARSDDIQDYYSISSYYWPCDATCPTGACESV